MGLPEPGAVAIFASHYQLLITNYYVFSALILTGRTDAESVFRKAYFEAQVCITVLEIISSALLPRSLSLRACAAATLLSAGIQLLHLWQAYHSLDYSRATALPLQVAAAVLAAPATQLGHASTLRSGRSPQRFRMLAWLTASAITVASLLVPGLARPEVALPVAVWPCLLLLAALLCSSQEVSSPQKQQNGADALVAKRPAALFLVLSCCSGTLGEALTDSAVTLAIRESLRGGEQRLALVNQVSICAAMLLAYCSETSASGGAQKHGRAFLAAWAACQLLRSCSLHLLRHGSLGPAAMAAFALLDKYTGPLGTASLDTALLALLQQGEKGNVRASLLWATRTSVARLERPLCQLLLLSTQGLPVHVPALLLTGSTSLGVLAIFQTHGLGKEKRP